MERFVSGLRRIVFVPRGFLRFDTFNFFKMKSVRNDAPFLIKYSDFLFPYQMLQ